MITLLGLEIAGVVLLFIYRERVDNFAKEVFDEVLKKYGAPNETKLTQNFDFVQYQVYKYLRFAVYKYIEFNNHLSD